LNERVHSFDEAVEFFLALLEKKQEFPFKVQKRLDMLDKNLIKLTNFCDSLDVPTTNNLIEGYFSASLQKGWKRRFKTVDGINKHLKLYQMKLQDLLNISQVTIVGVFTSVAFALGHNHILF
jgi:hypothetical protein